MQTYKIDGKEKNDIITNISHLMFNIHNIKIKSNKNYDDGFISIAAGPLLNQNLYIYIKKINDIYYISYDILSLWGKTIAEDNFKAYNMYELYDTIDYVVNTLRPRPLY